MQIHSITHASLGNNHTLDRGAANVTFTKETLDEHGIDSFGHYSQLGSASFTTNTINGHTFTHYSFNATYPRFDREIAAGLISSQAKKETFDIVHIHWGPEYVLSSVTSQKNIAVMMIEAGADLIIGHHPHVTQEVGYYNGVPIFYSLGNTVFDQYFSRDVQEGLIVELNLDENTATYTLWPIESRLSQSKYMGPERRALWLTQLSKRSAGDLQDDVKKGVIQQSW